MSSLHYCAPITNPTISLLRCDPAYDVPFSMCTYVHSRLHTDICTQVIAEAPHASQAVAEAAVASAHAAFVGGWANAGMEARRAAMTKCRDAFFAHRVGMSLQTDSLLCHRPLSLACM